MPWENGRKPQGKSGDSLPSCLPGLQPQAPAQGPRARQVHLRVPCPEIPGGKPEGPAGGEDRGCFLRQQGKIRRPPCHRGPAERRGEGQPQEGPENHAQAGPEGEDVQEEKTVQLLQGRGRQDSGEPTCERLHGRGAGQEVRHGRHGVQAPGREALPVSGDGPLQPEDRRLQHIAASRLRADPREDGERVRRTGREGERSPVPQRPGLAVPEEGVRGHPGGIRDGPVDVAEGQLPRQLGHGELLRAAEGRDVLRRGGTLQRLRKPEEGPQGLHRMVQLKPAERVPPLEVASGGSFQFRYSLITYP